MSAPMGSARAAVGTEGNVETGRPVLVLRRRDGVELVRLVPGERRLLGRAPTAEIVLPHPGVSRLHARIVWPEGRPRPVIEDLHSQNGVWFDGRRIADRTTGRAS